MQILIDEDKTSFESFELFISPEKHYLLIDGNQPPIDEFVLTLGSFEVSGRWKNLPKVKIRFNTGDNSFVDIMCSTIEIVGRKDGSNAIQLGGIEEMPKDVVSWRA